MASIHEMFVYRNDAPAQLTVFLGFKANLRDYKTEPVKVVQLGPHTVLRIEGTYERLLIGSEFFFDAEDALLAMRRILEQEIYHRQGKIDMLNEALEKLKVIKEEDKNERNTTKG